MLEINRSSMLNWIVTELTGVAKEEHQDQFSVTGSVVKKLDKKKDMSLNTYVNEKISFYTSYNENQSLNRRKYIRKTFFMAVDYSTMDSEFIDFIHDISIGGVFIGTRRHVPIGQRISILFSFPSYQHSCKFEGEVVRTSPQGVGVKFSIHNQDQKKIIHDFINTI